MQEKKNDTAFAEQHDVTPDPPEEPVNPQKRDSNAPANRLSLRSELKGMQQSEQEEERVAQEETRKRKARKEYEKDREDFNLYTCDSDYIHVFSNLNFIKDLPELIELDSSKVSEVSFYLNNRDTERKFRTGGQGLNNMDWKKVDQLLLAIGCIAVFTGLIIAVPFLIVLGIIILAFWLVPNFFKVNFFKSE